MLPNVSVGSGLIGSGQEILIGYAKGEVGEPIWALLLLARLFYGKASSKLDGRAHLRERTTFAGGCVGVEARVEIGSVGSHGKGLLWPWWGDVQRANHRVRKYTFFDSSLGTPIGVGQLGSKMNAQS